MKKILTLFLAGALMGAFGVACKNKPGTEICGISDFKIVNRIESDIVVELKFGDGQVTTIEPGETQTIHHSEWCRDANVELSIAPEILQAEMTIDGKTAPDEIWMWEHWETSDIGAESDNHRAYTLTVTDDLLEIVWPERNDVSFTEYSFTGGYNEEFNTHWSDLSAKGEAEGQVLVSDFIVINSDEEMGKYVEGEYPSVDFSKKTVLVVYGITSSSCAVEIDNFSKLSDGRCLLEVNVLLGVSGIIDRWLIAIVTDKIETNNKSDINLDITYSWPEIQLH